MQYYVVWPDGQKFGPADEGKLTEWLAEGRINADTELESVVDGSRTKVGALAGIAAAAQPVAASPVTPTQTASPDRYFVIGQGGQKFGPADVATLSQWAAENRLTATSELEHETTGKRTFAGQVPGLVMPIGQTQASPVQPYGGVGGQQGSSQPSYAAYPRETSAEGGKTEAIVSFVCSAIGVLCCPCLMCGAGIILGVIAKRKGSPLGQAAIIVGIVCFLLGTVIGVASFMSNPELQNLLQGR